MKTNAELVEAVLDGDHEAFETLVLRYERLVWSAAWSVSQDYHVAQDATQEAFLIAHHQLAELRDPDSLGFWLSRIARRESARMSKQVLGSPSIAHLDATIPDSRTDMSEEHELVLLALGELPEHEREVVALRYLNGHAVAEVALLTGRPVGTVTKQISRAMDRLKKLVTDGRGRQLIPHRKAFDSR